MMNIFRLYADQKSEYQSNDAIQWYLNHSCLQKLITKSLQRKDIDQLYHQLMCDMNEWNQSRKYLQYLLIHSNEQDLPWIEYFIGQTFYEINPQDSAVVLSSIGNVLYSQDKYEEAYDFYQQALEIREEYYEHFHVDIAISLDNISDILIDQKKYDQALEYQKRAMSICQEYYQSNHTYMALLLYRTGYILY
ncbi:unnamed protein product, partial [Adineta steineri]